MKFKITPFLQKYHKILLAFFLIMAAVLSIWAARADSETTDESVYIAASFEQLKYHDYHFNPEHPPLTKYFFALPLLAMKINEPPREVFLSKTNDYYDNGFWEIYQYGNKLLYGAGNDAYKILFWARVSSIIFMLLLGMVVFFWTKELFGVSAALFTALLYFFNPLILAMGHYATPDMGSALFFTLSLYLFWRYLKNSNRLNLALAGLGLGLAVLSRFSSLSLIILIIGWFIYKIAKERILWLNLKHFAAMLLIAVAVLWLGYGAPLKTAPKPNQNSAAQTVGITPNNRLNQIFHRDAHYLPLPYFFKGLVLNTYLLKDHGPMSFIDGKFSEDGFWYYFPLAFLYKTPIYIFILMLVLLALAMREPKQYFHRDNIYLLSAIILFLASAMLSKMDLGVRYILPIFILLFILLGQTVAKTKNLDQAAFFGLVLFGVIYTTVQISPKYLTYFNGLAGGPQKGWHHLADSNLDWGQDIRRLSEYLKANQIQAIGLKYQWKAEALDYEKIHYVLYEPETKPEEIKSRYLVINTGLLPSNRWLFNKNCRLLSRLGNSLYIFDLSSCQN